MADEQAQPTAPDLAAFKRRYDQAQARVEKLRSEMREAIVDAVRNHGVSEAGAARLTGVNRGTVRDWIGKPRSS